MAKAWTATQRAYCKTHNNVQRTITIMDGCFHLAALEEKLGDSNGPLYDCSIHVNYFQALEMNSIPHLVFCIIFHWLRTSFQRYIYFHIILHFSHNNFSFFSLHFTCHYVSFSLYGFDCIQQTMQNFSTPKIQCFVFAEIEKWWNFRHTLEIKFQWYLIFSAIFDGNCFFFLLGKNLAKTIGIKKNQIIVVVVVHIK